MSYSKKVKECKVFFDMMSKLTEEEYMEFTYSGKTYSLRAYVGYKGEMSYSVWGGISGMNVNKVGRTSLSLYTFDMMNQKTTYTIDVNKIVKEGEFYTVYKKEAV